MLGRCTIEKLKNCESKSCRRERQILVKNLGNMLSIYPIKKIKNQEYMLWY